MFRDCEGSDFTLRDGSPEFIYPGGNSGTDGGNVEEDRSEDAGIVEDPADSNDEVDIVLSLLLCYLLLFVSCCCFPSVPCNVCWLFLLLCPLSPSFPPSPLSPRLVPYPSTLRLPSFLRYRNLLDSDCLFTALHRVFPITLVAKLLIRRTRRLPCAHRSLKRVRWCTFQQARRKRSCFRRTLA
jgi:hypothetical protein